MARLRSGYDFITPGVPGTPVGPRQPDWVEVTASADECERIGQMPSGQRAPTPHQSDADYQFYLHPIDRRDVEHIAKRVEVQCDDERLIKWMATGGSQNGGSQTDATSAA